MSNILRYWNGTEWVVIGGGGGAGGGGYYGTFYDTTNQAATVTTNGYPIQFNTDAEPGHGVYISNDPSGNPTKINFQNAGTYNLQFSAQLTNTGANIADVVIWLRKNGTTQTANMADSSGFVAVTGSHGGIDGHTITSWNYVLTVAANDYLILMWATNDIHASITTIAAGTSPATPISPSVILTATEVTGTGPQGPTGLTGSTGSTGPTGPSGTAATIAVNSTTTVPYGSGASVSNVGSSSAAQLNFQIPAGPTGPQGIAASQALSSTPGRLLIYGHSYASSPPDAYAAGGVYAIANGNKAWPMLIRSMLHQGQPLDNVISAAVPALTAATATTTTLIGLIPEDSWIDCVEYVPNAAYSGVGANYRQFTVQMTTAPTAFFGGSSYTIGCWNGVSGQTMSQYLPIFMASYQNAFSAGSSYTQGAWRNASNAYTMAGVTAPGNGSLQWVSTKVGTGAADPGGIIHIRYNSKFRNYALGGSLIQNSGVFGGGWSTALTFRPLSQSYVGINSQYITGNPGEINVTANAAATASPTTISCDPIMLGNSLGSIASGQSISFGVGSNTYTATLAASVANGATSISVSSLANAIPKGSTGYIKNSNGGYEALVSNGLTLLNWGINDAGNSKYDLNAITESFRSVIANQNCSYMSGTTQANIQFAAGNGSGAVWADHAQPAGGQFWNQQSNTYSSGWNVTGSVKMFTGAVGSTPPTATIQLPPSFEGGTVDLFFLALAGANNGGAATVTVDGSAPPNGACTINTNNCSVTANISSITANISTTALSASSSYLVDPYNLGQFVVGTGVPANTYISQLGCEGGTVVSTNITTTATLSASASTGTGVSLSFLGFTPMVKRLINLASGPHSIVITLNSMGGGSNPAFFFYGYGIEPSNTLTPDLSAPIGVLNVAQIPAPVTSTQNSNAVAINNKLTGIINGSATSSQSGNSTEPAMNSVAFLVDTDTALGSGTTTANFVTDGLHLNSRGHAVVAKTIYDTMAATPGLTAINLAMTSG